MINEATANYIKHEIVLFGDSTFDNAPYVNKGDSVIEQLETAVNVQNAKTSETPNVTLSAVGGECLCHIETQLSSLEIQPTIHYHPFVSFGGNDLLLLNSADLMGSPVASIGEALSNLYQTREKFRSAYKNMLRVIECKFESHPNREPITLCTIYDKVPTLTQQERCVLGFFNEVILYEARLRNLPVIDLRVLCGDANDYSPISPIKPSKFGAAKIANAIYHKFINTKEPNTTNELSINQ